MNWYEDEVERLEKEISELQYEPKLVFYGSSSIRLWNSLNDDFKIYNPINLGFGGSTLEACVYFFRRIMQKLSPRHFIIYAGDNDLGDGKTPAEVYKNFQRLHMLINDDFPGIMLSYISIKPSLSRWQINTEIKQTNELIKTFGSTFSDILYVDIYKEMIGENGLPIPGYYDEDGLHLSAAGYAVWRKALLTHISLNIDNGLISV